MTPRVEVPVPASMRANNPVPFAGTTDAQHAKLPDAVENRGVPGLERRVAQRWRALVEGAAVRRHYHVRALADGAVFVQVRGGREVMDAVALMGPCAAGDVVADGGIHRHVAWLALDQRCFSSRLVADGSLQDPTRCASRGGGQPAGHRVVVHINGGFFNYARRSCQDLPEAASIGPSRSMQSGPLPCLPLPALFADDYQRLQFSDGSHVVSAPQLAVDGVDVFSSRMRSDPRYRLPDRFSFDAGDVVPPGSLWHAHDPNPRAGISMPASTSTGIVRLVVAPMPRRDQPASGCSLAAFAGIMARLDRMETPANRSVNLDGGESVVLQAWVNGVREVDVRQVAVPRRIGNFIGFSSR